MLIRVHRRVHRFQRTNQHFILIAEMDSQQDAGTEVERYFDGACLQYKLNIHIKSIA
jgi:hypothetical protein